MKARLSPRVRLALLLAAASGLWWARDRLAPDDLVARPAAARRAAGKAAPLPADLCTTPPVLPQRDALREGPHQDPFTGRASEAARTAVARATAPAPAPEPVAAPVAPPPVVVAAPATPRPPYRVFGLLHERNGDPSVFLGLGPALITARPGETLEGGYRLDAIGAREITFTHLATQKSVRLAVEGDAP